MANSDYLNTVHIDSDVGSSGIINLECVVWPPGRIVAAISNVDVVSAIKPSCRSTASNAQ